MFQSALRERLYTVIFGTDTRAGKMFDELLIGAILLSVLAVVLDSVGALNQLYGRWFFWAEWLFTVLFTVEYGLRVYCSPQRGRYVCSFYGVVDLLSVLPTYLALFLAGANYLMIIRLLRVLRIFRILKLVRYLAEANLLLRCMRASRRKIFLFFSTVLVLCTVFGSMMFVVEGPQHGFTSIPKSIYWTIVTITTVGYGDITPKTVPGQIIASLAMLTGYSIIAVPTGIITAELATEMQRDRSQRRCDSCGKSGHDTDAVCCKYCGQLL
jgi:voltage-gated potassium channel